MSTCICVAVRELSTAEAAAAALRARAWADLVEIRADYIRDLDLSRLMAEKSGPTIFTLRSRAEGGEFDGSERLRLETIVQAARMGAEYVDVEYSAFWKAVLEAVPQDRVILSHHNFDGTPDSLSALAESMSAAGAGTLKIAVTARSLADNLVIRRVLRDASCSGLRICALAMGREGIPSRVLGPLWGSCFAFASLPGGTPTADGQIPADELVGSYRVREIGPETAIYGVIGRPLGHTLSPRVHNAAFAARGMNAVYLPLEMSDFEDFRRFEEEVPLKGLSITIPYKGEACARAISLSVEADRTGAANTYVPKAAGWHGENTDVEGFLRPIRRRMHLAGTRCVVLGAGGGARAVVCALRSQGASTVVLARDIEKARTLAAHFGAEARAWVDFHHLEWDLLINTTPIGMFPESGHSPVPKEALTGKWVYDLVYNPRETRLLQWASARGLGTISGDEMFLAQAIKQQQLWCGSLPPEEAMREALDSGLRGRSEEGS